MPNPNSVNLEALADLRTPWALRVVVTLRIADHITAGRDELSQLARVTGSDAVWLGRVMRHLVEKGVFTEPARDQFALNEPARELLSPGCKVGLDLAGIGGRMAHAWGTLLSAVKTGAPAYQELFGKPFWEDLEANPTVAASFDELMGPAGHGKPDPEVLPNGDWSEVRTVVDVGGGTGSLLAEILRARPRVRGILVDLPNTVARSAFTFSTAGVSDRVRA
ncbi:MAG TPA: methyltransferase, partial [Verrucomicrobiae bacterium]|nr:methyltransferase [Verrucomicrobiae bacterium]